MVSNSIKNLALEKLQKCLNIKQYNQWVNWFYHIDKDINESDRSEIIEKSTEKALSLL